VASVIEGNRFLKVVRVKNKNAVTYQYQITATPQVIAYITFRPVKINCSL